MSHQSSKSVSSPPSPHHALPYTRRSSVSIPSLPQNPPQRRSRSFRESRNNVSRSTRYPTQFELEAPPLPKQHVPKTSRNRPPPLNCFTNNSSSTTERSSVSSASTSTTFFNTSTESSGSNRAYNRKNNSSTPNSASNWSVSSEYSTTSSVNKRVNAAGGKLAYLASRRGSIGSVCSSGCSTPPNTPGLGGNARGRRQSSGNFLEVPNTTSYTSTELTTEPTVMSSPLSRPRVNSLPATSIVSPQLLSPTYVPYSTLYNPRSTMTKSQDYLYRLRSFNITKGGGVVNCGDTIVRRSKSNNCINEDDFGRKASITYSPTRSPTKSQRSSPGRRGSLSPRLVVMSPLLDPGCCVATAQDYNEDEYEDELTMREFGFEDVKVKYRVVLLGESGVGKSALVRQFMTSEYINTYDMSLDEEYGEREVSVLLDSKESDLVFIDHPCVEMSVENSLATYEPHACVVVYSVTDRRSFEFASEILRYLWQEGTTHERSVILVGNKCDLARARVISSQEGKQLATNHDSKFIETSSGIQHNVDELLVGVLKQIRLREAASIPQALPKAHNRSHVQATTPRGSIMSLLFTRELINKLCFLTNKAKSCENLHVL